MANDTLFREVAPPYMDLLMEDFDLSAHDAAGFFGNFGHECNGFVTLQEVKPIAGGAGGWGWAQWTGERRREFEAYCARYGYNLAEPMANYKWLFIELAYTAESKVLAPLRKAVRLEQKVEVVMRTFERPHKDHYHLDRRVEWAKVALDAYEKWVNAGMPGHLVVEPDEEERGGLPTWLKVSAVVLALGAVVAAYLVSGGQIELPITLP